MTKNDILKSIQKIEKLDTTQILKLFSLANFPIDEKRIEGYLKEADDKAYLDCGAEALKHFLDGLIVYKRGTPTDKTSEDTSVKLTNNMILKKLRIAYELKEVDLFAIFHAVDIDITKSELSSLFRNENHKKFRCCPDSILQLFIEGLKICEEA